MYPVILNLGDTAYFHPHLEEVMKKRKGKVVHIFEMYGLDQYVIEIDTGIDPVLEVRSSLTVSDHPDQPIGMWRQAPDVKERIEKLREEIREKEQEISDLRWREGRARFKHEAI